ALAPRAGPESWPRELAPRAGPRAGPRVGRKSWIKLPQSYSTRAFERAPSRARRAVRFLGFGSGQRREPTSVARADRRISLGNDGGVRGNAGVGYRCSTISSSPERPPPARRAQSSVAGGR